jgi:hypothetical protein
MWVFGDGFQGLRPSDFKGFSFSLRDRFVKKKTEMTKMLKLVHVSCTKFSAGGEPATSTCKTATAELLCAASMPSVRKT